MLNRDAGKEILPFCKMNNLGTLTFMSLEQGLLTGKIGMDRVFSPNEFRSNTDWNNWMIPANRQRVLNMLATWKDSTDKYNCTLAQMVIAWTAAQPGVTHVLAGGRNSRQVSENAAAGALKLESSDIQRKTTSQLWANPPKPEQLLLWKILTEWRELGRIAIVNNITNLFLAWAALMQRCLIFGLVFTCSLVLCARATGEERPVLEPTEWTEIYVMGADQTNVTRVLMVGDSINGGYYFDVSGRMAPSVKCAKLSTSAYLGNPDYQAELSILLMRYKFAVIHINNGLHGCAIQDSDYAVNLPKLIAFLKKQQPQAKIIWAMTTPVRVNGNPANVDEGMKARVLERNRIAAEVMKKNAVAVNDLYTLVKDHPEYYNNDGTHFNDTGRAAQAAQVAASIQAQLDLMEKK